MPYLLIVGDKEGEAGTASARARHGGDRGAMTVDELAAAAGRRGGRGRHEADQLGRRPELRDHRRASRGWSSCRRRASAPSPISPELIIQVLFVAALIAFGYNYFRQNQLAWLVLKPWQRYVIIGCGVGIAFLLIGGFPLLGDRLTPLGVIALIAVLVLRHRVGRAREPPLPVLRSRAVRRHAAGTRCG